MEIAAWLHDLTKWERVKDHHITAAKEAEKILKKLNYSDDKIEKVKHCIISHRGSQNIKRKTKEAECVASADAIAHFDMIPSLYFIAYGINKKNYTSGNEWVKNHLKESWEKLIPEAKKIIKKKFDASQEIL